MLQEICYAKLHSSRIRKGIECSKSKFSPHILVNALSFLSSLKVFLGLTVDNNEGSYPLALLHTCLLHGTL